MQGGQVYKPVPTRDGRDLGQCMEGDYGKAEFTPTPAWEEELGDAFFSLVCLANSSGVDLESALQNVLGKYEARLSQKGDAGSGK